MQLLGRYSNWAYWTDRIENLSRERRNEIELPTRGIGAARRLPDDEVTELVGLYGAGATVCELATRFKIHRVTVSEHLDRQGAPMRGQSMRERQVTQAIDLYVQGWSVARIGGQLGFKGGTVWRALRKHCVRMRDTHGRER